MKIYSAIIASLMLATTAVVNAEESALTEDPRSNSETTIHTQSPLAVFNADDIEGKDVVDSAGHELGDIDEVVKDQSNRIMVVIGLTGSLKEVVVPLDKLEMTSDSDTLRISLSRGQLEALPDYDPMDMESVDE